MKESEKARARREREGFFERYCQGSGLDIGYGGDLVVPNARGWDLEDGDAQKLDGIQNDTYDFVYSSHCLEHMRDPLEALLNWWRVLKHGGFMIVSVPDEDLYELGIWPSLYNPDHKNTFTIHKDRTWSPVSYSLVELISYLSDHKILYVRTVDTEYDHSRKDLADQTTKGAEASIEAVVQKIVPDFNILTRMATLVRCNKCGYGRLGLEGITKEQNFAMLCNRCGERITLKFQVE